MKPKVPVFTVVWLNNCAAVGVVLTVAALKPRLYEIVGVRESIYMLARNIQRQVLSHISKRFTYNSHEYFLTSTVL